MSSVLSLLIFVPLAGSAVTYALSTLGGGRKAAIYSAVAFSSVTFLISGYSFLSVYTNTPPLGQYSLTEGTTWINLPGFTLKFLLGID